MDLAGLATQLAHDDRGQRTQGQELLTALLGEEASTALGWRWAWECAERALPESGLHPDIAEILRCARAYRQGRLSHLDLEATRERAATLAFPDGSLSEEGERVCRQAHMLLGLLVPPDSLSWACSIPLPRVRVAWENAARVAHAAMRAGRPMYPPPTSQGDFFRRVDRMFDDRLNIEQQQRARLVVMLGEVIGQAA
jgi:hypothetical protein